MAPRSTASDAGQWAGVAFTSAFPCRSLAAPWPPDLFETGRLQFGSFFTPAAWISGAVVYGFPEGKTHLNALQRTDDILDFAFHRLTALPGPRFMAGDWNFASDALAVTAKLQAAGWVEVQDHVASRTGRPVENTCKGVTRKDFLWLSPELALGLLELTVDHEVFADHAVLVARFAGGSLHLERFPWPCPKPVPWSRVPELCAAVDFHESLDPTAQYAQLWKAKETSAAHALGTEWMPQMGGRGALTKPRRVVGRQAPIKQGRLHDVQPGFFGFSAIHAKQFKQLRRLQNYCRWIDSRPATGVVDSLHGIGLWNSILKAPGFCPTFAQWWPTRLYVSPLDPVSLPVFCPPSAVAHQIYDAVLAEVRLFEQRLQNAKRANRQTQLERDRNLVFREVARSPAAPVDSLLHRVEAVVTRVDVEECAVELSRPVSLLPDMPVWVSGQQCEVIHADHDKIWLHDVSTITPEDRCLQTQHVGDLRALFDAFHEEVTVVSA